MWNSHASERTMHVNNYIVNMSLPLLYYGGKQGMYRSNFIEERAREKKKMHLGVFGEPFKAAKE